MSNNPTVPDRELLPPYLPPRRPRSLPNLPGIRSSWHIASAGVWQRPSSVAKRSGSKSRRKLTKQRQRPESGATFVDSISAPDANVTHRPTSYQSFSSGETAALDEAVQSQQTDDNPAARTSLRLESIPDEDISRTQYAAPTAVQVRPRPAVLRHSSLRIETRLSDEQLKLPEPLPAALSSSHSDPQLRGGTTRPYSHPISRLKDRESPLPPFSPSSEDPWRLTSRPSSRRSTPSSPQELGPKPRASLKRLSSLDNLLTFREARADWKRASSVLQQRSSEPSIMEESHSPTVCTSPEQSARPSGEAGGEGDGERPARSEANDQPESEKQPSNVDLERGASQAPSEAGGEEPTRPVFRHPSYQYSFCFTATVMQLLAEYLITGFALELPALLGGRHGGEVSSMGLFWPAALLTLIMSATLLIFARLSDMYGGYPCFMFGVLWLGIWTLVPGFSTSMMVLNVSRAMQGLAIAAYMPSTFALIGALFPEGPRRNIVLGFYSGSAPVGFFAGFLVAGALSENKTNWYFWTASITSFAMAMVAYISTPLDKTDRGEHQLRMDWVGGLLITSGLILVAYALSVEPYVSPVDSHRTGFSFPTCYGPFAAGLACLLVAFWYEGWRADSPLLPFDFFTPKNVKPLALACLCFYASYGVWLYNSAEFFQSPSGVTRSASSGDAISSTQLALWYAPTAIGGVLLCVCSGAIMHLVPVMALLFLSALCWLAAPLLLALAPLPLSYWPYVLPSMLCATIGLDLTYTISIIFLSSIQPLKYQGLGGAVASSLINLGMSFALPISEIALKRAQQSVKVAPGDTVAMHKSTNFGFRATFYYASASAGLGLIICVLFIRISRDAVSRRPQEEDRLRPAMSDATLVEAGHERVATTDRGHERSSM